MHLQSAVRLCGGSLKARRVSSGRPHVAAVGSGVRQIVWQPLIADGGLNYARAKPLSDIATHPRRLKHTGVVFAASASDGADKSSAQATGTDDPPGFLSRRLIVFLGILVGYTVFYLMRGSLTYTAPVMVAEPTLSVTKTDIGAMTSAFPVAYGISKFVSGILIAKFSPRVMLGMGLMITALVNISFGYVSAVAWWVALWATNGLLQGIGAPACATILTRWFRAKERGTYWGLWNIATNTGGFLAPLIVGTAASNYGWQWGMWVPGILGLATGFLVLLMVADKPQDVGFPPVEAVKESSGKGADKGGDGIQAALGEVLRSWQTWLLAITYFFVYMVRQGATSWLIFYLMEVKGAANAAQAALSVSGLELGGLLGGTLSGVLSDYLIRTAKEGQGLVGKRVQIVMGYTVATLGVLALLFAVPAGAGALTWLVVAALGFTIYGPQMLIGLCGAELVHPRAVGASQGILGLISYLGAANAGVPLAWLQSNFGWNGYFVAMAGACVCSLLLLTPIANVKSYAQKQAEAKAA